MNYESLCFAFHTHKSPSRYIYSFFISLAIDDCTVKSIHGRLTKRSGKKELLYIVYSYLLPQPAVPRKGDIDKQGDYVGEYNYL